MKRENAETQKGQNEGAEGASYRDQAVQFVSCAGTDGELRTVTIAPWGRTLSKSGEFVIDNEAVIEILSAFNDHSTAVPIDVEHETLDEAVPPGERKGAVGWIEKLWPESGKGLMGLVKWSERGRGLIRSDAYRFLSPVLVIRKRDRRAVALHSAGLTTKPAIPAMERLAASEHTETEQMTTTDVAAGPIVDMGDIAELLGVELIHGGAATLPARCHAKIKALKSESETVAAERERLNALAVTFAERDAKDLIAPYLKANKIGAEGSEFYALCLREAKKDPAAAKKWLDTLPSMIPPGRTTPPSAGTLSLVARARVIRDAVKAFKDYPTLAKLCTCKAHVETALRDKDLAPLTKEEVETLVV